MLPRTNTIRSLTSIVCMMLCATALGQMPARSLTVSPPEVIVQHVKSDARPQAKMTRGVVVTTVVAHRKTSRFSLVGVTWTGRFDTSTKFRIQTRSHGLWSTWCALQLRSDHGVDAASIEAQGVRLGTDPLIVQESDAVTLEVTNQSGYIPGDLDLTLIESPVTTQDRLLARSVRQEAPVPSSVTSPQGAVVQRPVIVSRAQWGADESWRETVPRMGTKIIAGFIHHTATTSSYTPAQAPGQMRNLYAYFTKSLKYADMGYNFLVDKYGTIYEGRAGCVVGSSDPCDGPSLPVQGAHTAGMNENTFAVSVIGNFDTMKPSDDLAAVIVHSLANLVAWKLAPYGLYPREMASITSNDTSGKSRYSDGQTAKTSVISAHRDVGLTVCPGRYLYPYMDQIRAKATLLLKPVLQNVSASPGLVDQELSGSVLVAATIPANAAWTLSVQSNLDGSLIATASGTQEKTSSIAYEWDLRNLDGETVAPGSYSIVVGASVNDMQLASATTGVLVAIKPTMVSGVSFTKVDKLRTRINWSESDSGPLPLMGYSIRFSSNHRKTWGRWTNVGLNTSHVAIRLHRNHGYVAQIVATNQLGTSPTRDFGFVAR